MDSTALINGYFEGSLTENQLEEFERLLRTDADFAAAFKFEKELQIALNKEERKEIKELFSSLNETKEKEIVKNKGKVISMQSWLAAATIALVVGIGSWFFFFNSTDLNTSQLYAANFTPYENVVHPIERGNQLQDLMSRAFTAYEDEKYNEALLLFKELNVKQNDDYIVFYEAIVLMQLNRHNEAIPLLKNYIENNGELKDRAHWYLALSYLKLDDVSNSKVVLEKLIELGSFKKDFSKDLLEDLE